MYLSRINIVSFVVFIVAIIVLLGIFDRIYISNNINSKHASLGVGIIKTNKPEGLKIVDVVDNSPAQKAGLQVGDLITHIDGKKVDNVTELKKILFVNSKNVVNLNIFRQGRIMLFSIKTMNNQ